MINYEETVKLKPYDEKEHNQTTLAIYSLIHVTSKWLFVIAVSSWIFDFVCGYEGEKKE